MSAGEGGSLGDVVARGKIRVDARRAVAKLREHLLVDLHLYTLEIARAAVAGGATRIDVEHDADEVSLTFDGESLDEGTLTRLLDHVLVEAVTPDARRKRLLAMGVNAALGLGPAHVDIFSRTGEGTWMRARWTPALLEQSDDAGAPMEAPRCERVAASEVTPGASVCIVVRRRMGWKVVRQVIAGGVPAEVSLLAGATHDVPVPLTLAGRPFPRAERAPAIVRVPFEVRGAKRAVLEIVPARTAFPQAEYLEHGIRLAHYAWSFAPGFPSEPLDDVALPVRVIVDAEELPTNASRSELRLDAPLLSQVERAALPAFHDAVLALVAVVTGRGEVPPGVEVIDAGRSHFEDALGAIVCLVVRAARGGAELSERERELLELPLLRDGHGQPIPVRALVTGAPSLLYVWRGKEPLPEDLSPWTRDMLWVRGRVIEKIIDVLKTEDAAEVVRQAKLGAERRRVLLAHAPSEPALPPLGDELLREAFDVREGAFEGLRGEVAVVQPGPERPASVVRVFVEGRHLDTVAIKSSVIPLCLEIAIAWEGRLRPTLAYDGVAQDTALHRAIWYAARVATLALGRAAVRLGEDLDSVAGLRAALRAAIGTLFVAARELGLDKSPEELPLSSIRGLHQAPVWPTTEPGRWESVKSLEAVLASARAICTAKHGATGMAPDGRPVIVAKRREVEWLAAALAPDAVMVPYDTALLGAAEREDRDARRLQVLEAELAGIAWLRGPVMAIERSGVRGLMAIAPVGKLVLMHGGRQLPISAFGSPPGFTPSLGPVALALDDDTVVPKPEWDGVLRSDALTMIEPVEREFCATIVAALEGDDASRGRLRGGIPDDLSRLAPPLCAYLVECARQLKARSGLIGAEADAELLARIEALPLVTQLDESGSPVRVSLASIEERYPAPRRIPVLSSAPEFETLEWCPVILASEGMERAAFQGWSGGRAHAVESEIPGRTLAARVASERRAFMARPEQDPRSVGVLADPGARVVVLDHATGGLPVGYTVAVALPASSLTAIAPDGALMKVSGDELTCAWIDVLHRGRAVCRRVLETLALPVVARININDELAIEGFRDLSAIGVHVAVQHVGAAAVALAAEIVADASQSARSPSLFEDLRALRLVAAIAKGAGGEPPWSRASALRDALRDALVWPTVQGEAVPLQELRAADDEIYAGSVRHVPWAGPARGKSELDAPILYVPSSPEGALITALVAALGFKCRAVTDAIAKLQARRNAARPLAAPTLPGLPPHPSLRASLSTGGSESAEGELEIIEGPASDVRFIGLDGAERSIPAELPFPLRVIARVDILDTRPESNRAVLKEVIRVAVRHLLSLAPRVEEMPTFVRVHLRGALLRIAAQRGKLTGKQKRAPVLIDTTGAWSSIATLQADGASEHLYTTAAPPYPKRQFSRPVLVLTPHEAKQLGAIVKLKDVTPIMSRELAGEGRANAPQVSLLCIHPDVRARCLRIVSVNEDGMTGEIGILAPDHARERGIHVHVTRRPLCSLEDGPGWPIRAVINDDAVPPNRMFHGVRTTRARDELVGRIRAIADRELKAWLAPPVDAIAVRWIDSTKGATSNVPMLFAGSLWLPPAWPREPRVRIHITPGEPPSAQPFVAPGQASHIQRTVPVCAEMMVGLDVPWSVLESLAISELAAMIKELAASGREEEILAPYRWNLGLLGSTAVSVPEVRAADGRPLRLSDVIAELGERGCLWTTRRRGSADGAFPQMDAGFVLVDEPSPLLEVLRHRAPPAVLRELGDLSVPASRDLAIQAAASWQTETTTEIEVSWEPDADLHAEQARLAARADEPPPVSWVERLRLRIAQIFADRAKVTTDLQEQSGLCVALNQAIVELGLMVGPVLTVAEAKTGPAFRYDRGKRRLVINRHHRALRWLRSSDAPDARALSILVAAAVSEINRALDTVTDAEERHVLQQLLQTGVETRVR